MNRDAMSCCKGWGHGQEIHCALLFFRSCKALRVVKVRGFALVPCITMCTIYATRQAHRLQPLGICSQHRTKSRITMRVQSSLGHSDGENHVSMSMIRSNVFFMKPLPASMLHGHRTEKKTFYQLDHICPLSEVIRMFLMLACSIRSFHWLYETAFCRVFASSGSLRPTVYHLAGCCGTFCPWIHLTHRKLYNQASFLFQLFYT